MLRLFDRNKRKISRSWTFLKPRACQAPAHFSGLFLSRNINKKRISGQRSSERWLLSTELSPNSKIGVGSGVVVCALIPKRGPSCLRHLSREPARKIVQLIARTNDLAEECRPRGTPDL